MATDLFLEMAELPATGSLGTGQLDTRDLLVAGLYLELSGSTKTQKTGIFNFYEFFVFSNVQFNLR